MPALHTLVLVTVLAQTNATPDAAPAATGRARRPGADVVSPEIHADHTVTFRLYAPEARKVLLAGAWLPRGQSGPVMTKDDKGVWTVTAGPVPHVTDYQFVVDGLAILDPKNPQVKRAPAGPGYSLLKWTSSPAALWDAQEVPHGVVHQIWYKSTVTGQTRRMHVYTPPAYNPSGKMKYPTLYLLHGGGDEDEAWISSGHTNFVMDNMLAQKKVKPMVIVMPEGHVRPAGAPPGGGDAFTRELIESIIPTAEREFRLSNKRTDRALAGLSMGGGQTLSAGLANLDRFSHLGVFSIGVRDDSFEKQHEKALTDFAGTNKKLAVFMVACGDKDSLYPSAVRLDEVLTKHQIQHTFRKSAGAHEWANWTDYFVEFAPQLFRVGAPSAPRS